MGQTSQIQTKAARTAQAAMTDDYVAHIQEMARKDAQKGVYMDREYIQFSNAHKTQHVSPDRTAPMMQASQVMQQAGGEKDPLMQFLDAVLKNISGKAERGPDGRTVVTMNSMAGGCSGYVNSGACGQTAEIYSPDGEMIAGFNSNGGGWTICPTQAENRFLDLSASVYRQAFEEARAEMKAPREMTGGTEDAPVFDVRF